MMIGSSLGGVSTYFLAGHTTRALSTEPERGGCMGIKGGDHDQSQSAGAYGPRKMGIVAKDICVGMVQRGHRDRSQSAGRI